MNEVLDGYEVMDVVPKKYRVGKWNSEATMTAFLLTGNECMGKTFSDLNDAKHATMAYRQYVRSKEMPIEVSQRGNKVLLIRKGEE